MSDEIKVSIIEETQIIAQVTQAPSVVVQIKDGHIHLNKTVLDQMEHAFTESERAIIYTYIHDQMVSSDTWVVTHNLDKYPSVSVVDSAGSLAIGDVQYISRNQLIVTFIGEFSGKAYLN